MIVFPKGMPIYEVIYVVFNIIMYNTQLSVFGIADKGYLSEVLFSQKFYKE